MQPPNLVNTFLQEADDLLCQIEETVLDLNAGEAGEDTVNSLFRAFHTIKGSAGMFGFDAVSSFTHHIENVLDRVRSGDMALSPELLEIVLAAKDRIKLLLEGTLSGDGSEGDQNHSVPTPDEIIARLASFSAAAPATAPTAAGTRIGPALPAKWRIRFRPDPALLATGGNPALILRELRSLGECAVVCHSEAVPTLDFLQPDKCYLWWDIVLESGKDADSIRDVFMFVEEGSEIEIERLLPEAEEEAESETEAEPATGPVIPEFLPPAAVLPGLAAEHAAEAATQTPAQNAAQTAASRDECEASGEMKSNGPRKPASREATVRVPSAKLDLLVNLVGELVMNQSRLTQAASRCGAPELAAPVEEIERLVAQLRDNVLSIRMMPIGTTFSRFKRLVHDLAAELGKDIDLVTEGAETQLDKTVLDQLGDPLVHLIRNSIDHGIERGDDRIRLGKPERGTIRLTAVHTGSNVVVRIQDDGRGLDQARIRSKAIEKHLIAADASLSEKELSNLIFLPGFSTAQQVTNVSGRGVGMDVVRRQIDALRGSISVSSQKGAGTTIALTLPLTLAIIDGLLVQAGTDQFIVPMSLVTENVELQQSERARNNGRNVIAVRGELIPYMTLREVFDVRGARPEIEKIVIVRHEDQRVGLVVDRVIGSHQTVIQPLGTFYHKIEAFSGATIMGDGRVALILDLAGLIRAGDGLRRRDIGAVERAGLPFPALLPGSATSTCLAPQGQGY